MKLVRLHIQGFKSFKDRTTIHFDQGITGIVGPNGCGKSNIVDALFWVMGEQSAKHLRGKSMQDLIFSGSSKYTPASWAEVTLVLENDTGKHIHVMNQLIKPHEIALTRKLYRNGETEYRINNQPARLKDIQEVFMDTGAGAKSYSIIAQGEINRLVQAKPEDRRTMIEEVAGITKFKLRKRDSVKKIEHTQANLNRLQDLQAEIYKNLKALEKQAEKAERARTLKERIKRHELIVESHREYDFLNEFREGRRLLDDKAEQLEKDTIERDTLEVTLEDERVKKLELTEQVDEAQAEYNRISKELAAAEERLNYLKRSIEEKAQFVEAKQAENEELDSDIESRNARLQELEADLEEIQSANYGEMDFSDLEEKVETLKQQMSDKAEELSSVRTELEVSKEEFSQLDQLLFKNTSKLEEYATNLQQINEEIETLEKHTSNFTDELKAQRDKKAVLATQVEELEVNIAETKSALKSEESELSTVETELKVLTKEVIQIESKRQSLIEINKNEGAIEGANKFLDEAITDTYQIFGNLIETESTYGKCVETLFFDVFNSLVTVDSDSSILNTWAADHSQIPWDLMIFEKSLDSFAETSQRLELRLDSKVTSLSEVVKFNSTEFSDKLVSFFDGYFIVENIDRSALESVAKDVNFKGLISADASIVVKKANGSIKISQRDPSQEGMGFVQRNNLIAELGQELESKQAYLNGLETKASELTETVSLKRESLQDMQDQFNQINSEYIAVKSSLESKESGYDVSFSRLELLNKRKTEISAARLDLMEKDEELSSKSQNFNTVVEEYNEQLENLNAEFEELKLSFEAEREELLKLQANANSFESQIKGINSQIEDTKKQIERYEDKKEQNLAQLEKMEEESQQMRETIVELEASNYDQVDELSGREEGLSLIKDQLAEILLGMQDRESRVKELTQAINKNEKSVVEIEMKMKQIVADEEMLVRNVFERYKIDLRDILAKFLEISPAQLSLLEDVNSMYFMETEDGMKEIEKESYEFEKRYPAAVKESAGKFKNYKTELGRLGDINWQAIEEYDRQKLRYDFLRQQEQELKESLEDLQRAIDHIDEKCRVRFKEAFEEVDTRFSKVFPIIFGGGSAKLQIVGDLDSPECGIEIIAQPPGKKMQNINLMSGGEKAMTAVSLIFSIFLVKPSPFCLLDEVDAPLDDANVGRFNELLREMSAESQFILITHNKKTMELNDTLYGVTMQEAGVSKAVSVQLH